MSTYQRLGLCLAGSLGLAPQLVKAANPPGKSPHIILIITDQQRNDALGCTSNNVVKKNG